MVTLNVDTERVITEVRLRPLLWDLNHNLYKDRDARAKTWTEVYEALFTDYDDMEDYKKKDIEKMVHQRWKTARDAYIRCKNALKNTASSSGSGIKKYAYFENIKFLDKKDQPNVEDSIESNHDTLTVTNENEGSSNLFNQEPDTSNIDIPGISNKDPEVVNYTRPRRSYNSGVSSYRNKMKTQRKRKRTDSDTNPSNKEMLTMLKENAKLYKNDDLLFFMSFLPITKKFTTHQKLLFRAEIIKKTMEIVNMPNPYEGTSRPGSSNSNCEDYGQEYPIPPNLASNAYQDVIVKCEVHHSTSPHNSET